MKMHVYLWYLPRAPLMHHFLGMVCFFFRGDLAEKVSFSKHSHFLYHVKSPGFQFGDFDGKYLHNFLNYCLQTCTHRMGCVCLRLRNHKELL